MHVLVFRTTDAEVEPMAAAVTSWLPSLPEAEGVGEAAVATLVGDAAAYWLPSLPEGAAAAKGTEALSERNEGGCRW